MQKDQLDFAVHILERGPVKGMEGVLHPKDASSHDAKHSRVRTRMVVQGSMLLTQLGCSAGWCIQ